MHRYKSLCCKLRMQQPSSDYSPDLVKETCARVELRDREDDLHTENAALSGSSSPEVVFSSCEMQTVPVCMATTLPPGDYILRRGYTGSSLLRLPTEECIGIHHAPFQFDRHARARISTSPTLRRLRMASASQALTLQDCSDTAQLGNQKEYTGSLHHICKSPPRCITISSLSLPSCVHAKLLSSKAKSETTTAAPESDVPRSKLPSQEDPLSNSSSKEPPRNSWRANSATLPKRLPCPSPTLWVGVQESGLPMQRAVKCHDTTESQSRSAERRRSSLVVSLPGLEVFPGDLLVSDSAMDYLPYSSFLLSAESKKSRWPFAKRGAISLSLLKTFFEAAKKHVSKSDSPMDFSSILRTFFQGDLCQTHQIYCLNYTSAVFYLEKLRQREDFSIYLKWCEQNEQCKRLHLPELLVAPLHRLMRYPLLLNNIWKRSTDETEKSFIQSLKEKVEKSIRDLEGKVKWLDNFQKFRQLQEVIIWPQVWDRDKRFFVPECLKQNLRENSSENILSSVNRLLLHEGRLMLAESTRLLDVYLFLFDDFLLITKIKRNKKKYGGSDTSLIPVCPSLTPELQSFIREGGLCTVLDQPIPLDRLILKNVEPVHITVFSLRNAFLIQHENRYRQCIAVFLLQAQTETAKKAWMSQIETAISNYTTQHETKKSTAFCFPVKSSEI
uniref:Pleckstrin homology and RhoGEF domain containing G7 n=1 Tax=Corvus moneduloides TaxID=1196302 RepID=A0A8U7NXQ7_CORMO